MSTVGTLLMGESIGTKITALLIKPAYGRELPVDIISLFSLLRQTFKRQGIDLPVVRTKGRAGNPERETQGAGDSSLDAPPSSTVLPPCRWTIRPPRKK